MVVQVGEIYTSSNCGNMEVIEYINSKKVKVRFIATGYEKFAEAGDIRNGAVKDVLVPSVYGVGYIGSGPHKAEISKNRTKEYATWQSMLQRCYDPKHHIKNPNYKGCSVVKEWHNFQVFAPWFNEHYIDGYHLDKDIKVPGNKVYGPDTCTFVTQAENTVAAHAPTVVFRNPAGERVEVHNVSAFARETGLNRSCLSALNTGKRKTHMGWTKWVD